MKPEVLTECQLGGWHATVPGPGTIGNQALGQTAVDWIVGNPGMAETAGWLARFNTPLA